MLNTNDCSVGTLIITSSLHIFHNLSLTLLVSTLFSRDANTRERKIYIYIYIKRECVYVSEREREIEREREKK